MPKAKKDLGPLLSLLEQPLLQILAAVGLLLSGVLGLVRNLVRDILLTILILQLSGLGLGGIIDNVLGTLGLDKVVKGLGLGKILGK